MAKTFRSRISEWREYILFILAFIQIIGIIVAAYLGSRLAPITQDIAIIQTELSANNDEHDELVTKDAFEQVVERINHISSRVDQIYGIIK